MFLKIKNNNLWYKDGVLFLVFLMLSITLIVHHFSIRNSSAFLYGPIFVFYEHTYCMIAHAYEHISLDELEVSDGRFLNDDTHYYETDQITKIPGITNHKYNALHLNIRSLPTNIELLHV